VLFWIDCAIFIKNKYQLFNKKGIVNDTMTLLH